MAIYSWFNYLPINSMVIFHSYVNVYQRVTLAIFHSFQGQRAWRKGHQQSKDQVSFLQWEGDIWRFHEVSIVIGVPQASLDGLFHGKSQ